MHLILYRFNVRLIKRSAEEAGAINNRGEILQKLRVETIDPFARILNHPFFVRLFVASLFSYSYSACTNLLF